MERKIFTSFMLIATIVAYSQCNIASFIIDSDGYVNVRSAPNSKSEIITKLNSGTVVYYERKSESKWYQISLKKEGVPLGYVHSSRLHTSNEWPLPVYIDINNESYANICDAPNGSIKLQLPTTQLYTLGVSDYQSGWWKIEHLEFVDYEQGEETAIPIPSNSEYWIHTASINTEIKGDGYCSFNFLTTPAEDSSIIQSYPAGELPSSIDKIFELSPNKLFIKLKLKDGNIGWAPINIICYNPFTTCD